MKSQRNPDHFLFPFKAGFNIYGLRVEIETDSFPIIELFLEDLETFQKKLPEAPPWRNPIKIQIRSFPDNSQERARCSLFSKEWRLLSQKPLSPPRAVDGKERLMVCHYGKGLIKTVTFLDQGLVQSAVAAEPSLLPDPAFTFCLIQPLSVWLKSRGLFFIHAGCVARRGRGILFIGPPKAGKSTLTTCAVSGGFRFLGDDQPSLSLRNGRLRVHAFPRRARLDRNVAAHFRELKPPLSSFEGERLVFPIERFWPGCVAVSCQPHRLIFPRFLRGGRLHLTRLNPTQAFSRLLHNEHFTWYRDPSLNELSLHHLTLWERLVNQAPAYELSYDMQDIPRMPLLFDKILEGP